MTTSNATDRALAHLASADRPRRFVLASAPGRVNLIGEHVDHEDGVVLPVAIDRRATVAVASSLDGATTIAAPDIDAMERLEGPPPSTPLEGVEFANHRRPRGGGWGRIATRPLDLQRRADQRGRVLEPPRSRSRAARPSRPIAATIRRIRGRSRRGPHGGTRVRRHALRLDGHARLGRGTPGSWLRIDCRDLSIEAIPSPRRPLRPASLRQRRPPPTLRRGTPTACRVRQGDALGKSMRTRPSTISIGRISTRPTDDAVGTS